MNSNSNSNFTNSLSQQKGLLDNHKVNNNNNELGPRQDTLHFSQNIEDNINMIRSMNSKLDNFESKSNFINVLDDTIVDRDDDKDIMNKILNFNDYSKKILIDLLMNGVICNDIDNMDIDNMDNGNLINSIYNNADNYTKKLIISSFSITN